VLQVRVIKRVSVQNVPMIVAIATGSGRTRLVFVEVTPC